MKLSIITINYNNAAGLKKTLDSVAAQTYREFEHIIVDGASTDGSVDVIKDYVKKASPQPSPEGKGESSTLHTPQSTERSVSQSTLHNTPSTKIIWVSEPDTGIYNAMNKGIRKATGEYCLFLNSGDYLVGADVIDAVFKQCNGADILCARCNVSDKGKVVWTSHPPKQITFGTLYYVGLAHQSTFIKRSLFDTCGLYREDFKYNSDIAFWYKAIIDHHASTQTIDVVTTDYNLDGISSKESHTEQYMREHEQILAPYSKFIADYEAMKIKEQNNAIWYWVERHKCIANPIKWVYKLACKLNHKQ